MRLAGTFWILYFLLVHGAAAGAEPTSSLSPGPAGAEERSEQAFNQHQYKCLESPHEDPRENRTGIFCARMWDGLLCWDETPAGTSVTQSCPDRPDLHTTEKVTRHCSESGNWARTGFTCQHAVKDKLEGSRLVRDAAGEPTGEATETRTEKSTLENEKRCLEKMKREPPYNEPGPYCSRNWDGWLCWDDTPAGGYASQSCPDYGADFNPAEKATKYCGADGQWFRHPDSDKIWTNYTLCTSSYDMKLKLMIHENERRCLQKLKQNPPTNLIGLYCGGIWDGWLCWDHTPAGTCASQSCPNPNLYQPKPAEKATKYCGEDGRWFRHPESNVTWTNYTLCVGNGNEELRAAAQLSGDTEMEPTMEALAGPVDNQKELERQKKLLDNQYKCFEKMNRDPHYNKSDLYCNRTWDGWLCWEDTPAGTYIYQNCPNYFEDFDTTEKAIKYCGEDGQWFRHPDTNRTWSNYTLCNENTNAKLKSAYILFYMAIVGHALSIASLLISLAIFFYFRSLSCQRITLHKNLFFSYVLNSALTIIYLVTVVNNPSVVARNPVGCKVLHFFHMYMLGCNYFWMLCEGIYLHTLIVVAVFAEEQHLHWYYLLGWGFPLVPVSIHAVARKKYFDDNCWMSVDTHLLYAVHGPIVAALLVNLFFLLNIIRVLVTKLRDTHRAESNMYMKAVRATLILVPLLGIQFVIFPWRPENRLAGDVYEYVMHILMHYQGLLVATIFCFFNGEVQAALKRQWMQYKTQWGQRRKDHCSMRSTSYTATSITEVPAFMFHHECNTEHMNGRHTEDSELVALKSGDAYA
ncbi:calcitonin gene-related peptide type 1 receptor isoform X2 [Cololabis saira]|uniref:calcitonin gene-related peptide type 1 receptor isoform X2 n=1 Tax=Cololabis saira TaxID=129043 RepID=UPI002AD2E922|nr:calcitonin gene-related peptide type 1 receptor isoform X2 [Cololabis saira]